MTWTYPAIVDKLSIRVSLRTLLVTELQASRRGFEGSGPSIILFFSRVSSITEISYELLAAAELLPALVYCTV